MARWYPTSVSGPSYASFSVLVSATDEQAEFVSRIPL